MNRYALILFFVLQACSSKNNEENISDRPNIIYIMADDHAINAISAYGSKLIQTPNIDRIANEGMLFRNCFVTNSICAPSRAVLLTGKYSHLNGLRDNRDAFDGSQVTFPKLLQLAGYQTAMIGKWHLKTEPTGFDYYNILRGQGYYYNPIMISRGDTTTHEGYATDIITDMAIDYINQRDKDKPFLLLYHHKAPHREWSPNLKHLELFSEDLPIPETFYDDYSTRSAAAKEADMRVDDMFLSLDMKLPRDAYEKETGTGGAGEVQENMPEQWESMLSRMTPAQRKVWNTYYDSIGAAFKAANLSGKELLKWKYQRYIKDYLRCIFSVDENIGRLLDYLDENDLTKNTIVVYTSDQGFYLGEHGWFDKRFMYEESLRTPLMVRFPGEISPGSKSEKMALNLDFAPTLLDYAGVKIPDEMQGQSLRPILDGDNPENWRESMYYHYYEYPHGWHEVKKHYGIRTARYKLIHFYDDIDAWELYDLQEDPNELNNLIENPDKQELIAELKIHLKELMMQYKVDDVSF